MAATAGVRPEVARRGIGSCVLGDSLVRIPQRGCPAIRGLLYECLERNTRMGIKQTIDGPKIFECLGSKLAAIAIHVRKTAAGGQRIARAELRQAEHECNLQVTTV